MLSRALTALCLVAAVCVDAVQRDAQATPVVRATLYGDRPGEPYVPDIDQSFASDTGEDVIQLKNAEDKVLQATVPKPLAGAQRTAASVPEAAQPQSVLRNQSAAPMTVLPGVNEPGVQVLSDNPLAGLDQFGGFGDLRLVDEADALADDYRRAFEAETDQMPAETEVSQTSEMASAVAEAARATRETRIDATMQSQMKASIEQETEVIEFRLVDLNELDKAPYKDGVLGLVRVIDGDVSEELMIDAEGRVYAADKSSSDSALLNWQAKAVPLGTTASSNDVAVVEALGAAGDATTALMNRVTTAGQQANQPSGLAGSLSVRDSISYGRLLDPSTLSQTSNGNNNSASRDSSISFAQFLQIVRNFVFQPQVILLALGALAAAYLINRATRAH